jgi:hypothetical protein
MKIKYLLIFIIIIFLIIIGLNMSEVQNKYFDKKSDYSNFIINKNCKLIDINGDTLLIDKLQKKILFVFTPYSCKTCILNQINQLKQVENSKLDINLIGYFETQRDLIIFTKLSGIKHPIYRTSCEVFFNRLDQYSFDPYFLKFENKEVIFIYNYRSSEDNIINHIINAH